MSQKLTTALALLLMLGAFLSSTASAATNQADLSTDFQTAAKEYGVPVQLLLAVGYINTHLRMPTGPSEAGEGWGVMNLRIYNKTYTLSLASKLTGIPQAKLKTDALSNIRGGAALLAFAQGSSKSSNLSDWYGAVAKVRGSNLYADQVYSAFRSGATAKLPTGERIAIPALPVTTPQHTLSAMRTSAAEYSSANWIPASSQNYTQANRPTDGQKIDRIVIHVTVGSYASTINWFQNPNAQVSAQYVIRSSDGQITQMVRNEDIGWHAGNWDYN